eukprot:CAMPEP_0180249748 /NCGR_PEP_ID=MMETSP0987-20121128/37482_1 /TAXON_ID=697907 /ORGANISM="non described non described, Strain CCMP2293" /LENGTH=70 /DNA_ID=CAMNT_0022218069 /DNA_START=259 /DNA_END=471 /DNA_ORIENTATION=+
MIAKEKLHIIFIIIPVNPMMSEKVARKSGGSSSTLGRGGSTYGLMRSGLRTLFETDMFSLCAQPGQCSRT